MDEFEENLEALILDDIFTSDAKDYADRLGHDVEDYNIIESEQERKEGNL